MKFGLHGCICVCFSCISHCLYYCVCSFYVMRPHTLGSQRPRRVVENAAPSLGPARVSGCHARSEPGSATPARSGSVSLAATGRHQRQGARLAGSCGASHARTPPGAIRSKSDIGCNWCSRWAAETIKTWCRRRWLWRGR